MQTTITDQAGWSVSIISLAKMAESIKMLFGLRTWVGPRKHVLDEVHIPPWEGAISRGEWATTKIQSM